MEKLKEIWKELAEIYKDQKTELAAMLVFMIVAAVICVYDVSKQAVPVSSQDPWINETQEEQGQNEEDNSAGEEQNQNGGDSAEEQNQNGGDSAEEQNQNGEDSAEEEQSRNGESTSAGEDQSRNGEDSAGEEQSRNGEEQSPEAAENSGMEAGSEDEHDSGSEGDTEEETEEETELILTEEEALELIRRHDRRRLAALGREFIIPMAMPEGYVRPEYQGDKAAAEILAEEEYEAASETEEAADTDADATEDDDGMNTDGMDPDSAALAARTLRDTREMHGYEMPPLPGEEEEESRLEALIEEQLASYDGDWSVYVKNLKTEETVVINDRPMKSASVMKLFILGTMYSCFESGEMERTDELTSLMNDMIIYSSNDASNELLYRLGDSDYSRGIARVNEFIQESGFSDMTVEYNGFDDPATNTGTGNYNQVTAKDCGLLLEAIYRREWVSRSVCNEIEQMMLNQNTRYKIPAGLPDGVLCGNKSGEMDTTENDAAIIYADSCDYILVILSSDWSSKDEAITRIQTLSALVYEYYEE